MKNPEHHDGYLKIFPNYNHAGRKDGIGYPSLSPKSLGPVHHGQPGLPVALNLENLHQGSKAFPQEVTAGKPNELFYKTRLGMYADPIPHRHKFEKYPELAPAGKNKNVPVFSVWVRPDGTEQYLSYFESRQIYCVIYEEFVKSLPDFITLKAKLADGYNLQICGYDAYPVDKPTEQVLDKCYCDTSKPFGHELVLYCMLLGFAPWKKYITLPNILK